ncbi:MAG: DUF3596 domain-containing protein, partial [Cyanobacteria bacterium P01_F01_bin.13]
MTFKGFLLLLAFTASQKYSSNVLFSGYEWGRDGQVWAIYWGRIGVIQSPLTPIPPMPFDTPQQGSSEGSQPKKPRRRKASKGTVQIKNSNGRLQLVFTYGGKRRYISVGFEDSPETRELDQMNAKQIRLEMLSGNFD